MYNSGKIKDEDLPWKIEKRKSGHMMIVIKKPRNIILDGISN